MFWSALSWTIRTIIKVSSLVLMTVSIVLSIVFYYMNVGTTFILTEEIKGKIEVGSWIYAGIVGIVSFLSLFVAFTYDNKLINASRNLKQIFKPYGLDLAEYQHLLDEYQRSILKGLTINVIYWLMVFTTTISIFTWAVGVLVYIEFKVMPPNLTNITSIVNFNLILLWIILTVLLLGITIFIKLIKNNKDPLGKGFLPQVSKVHNVDYLTKQEVDINEILKVICPTIEIYTNNKKRAPKFELNIEFPILVNNLGLVVKFYDSNDDLLLRIFGTIENHSLVGSKCSVRITDNLDEELFSALKEETTNEISFYNKNNQLISKIELDKIINDEKGTIVFHPVRILTLQPGELDNDVGNLSWSNEFGFTNERQIKKMIRGFINLDEL